MVDIDTEGRKRERSTKKKFLATVPSSWASENKVSFAVLKEK